MDLITTDSVRPIMLEGDCVHQDGGPYRMLTMSLDAQLQLAMAQMQEEERARIWKSDAPTLHHFPPPSERAKPPRGTVEYISVLKEWDRSRPLACFITSF